MNTAEALGLLGSLSENEKLLKEAFDHLVNLPHSFQSKILSSFKSGKVEPQAYINIKKLGIKDLPEWYGVLEKRYIEFDRRRKCLKQAIEWLDGISRDIDLNPVLIKGAAIHFLYGDVIRASNDMDVWIEDTENLWKFVSHMRMNGCQSKEAWFLSRREDTNEPWFLTGLWSREFENGECDFDLHSGKYSTMFLESLRMPGLKEVAVGIEGYSSLRQLNPEASLLLLIGHSHSHNRITIRDINDAYILLTKTKVDLLWFWEQIKINSLEEIATELFNWMKIIYPDTSDLSILNLKVLRNTRNKEMWPVKYNYKNVLNHWWNYSNETGYTRVKEIVTLSWANIFANVISPKLSSQDFSKYTEGILNKISKFRTRSASYYYMCCPQMFEEDVSIPMNMTIDEQFATSLRKNGCSAVFDQLLNSVIVKLNNGFVHINTSGVYIASENLLFSDEIIEDTVLFLENNLTHLKSDPLKYDPLVAKI
ncbi:nucleotidyltransferase family protein [Paenibacillus sp. NPDC057967]|uniref:nucleotidyltransferase family protein n=1 Tax=Paenibacillus sp. NPDC057967 TaxID=3346293 RepID=UPI0036D9A315